MWSWINKRRRPSAGAAWVIRRQSDGLSLQFGSADPVVFAWEQGDAHAQARLLAVLRLAARTSPPGQGQLRLEASGADLDALQAVLQDALGARAGQALAGVSSGLSRLREQLAHLPLRGLALMVIVLALGMVFPLERPPATPPTAPVAAPVPQSVLAGLPPTSPLGWIEALAQQASAAGAGDWRLIELRAAQQGAFQLRIQMLSAPSAPLLGGTDPAVAKLEALRQVLDRQPGRVSVAMQPARGEGVLVFKPSAGVSGAGSASVEAIRLVEPVQSVAMRLSQLGPKLSWSEIRGLSMERDLQQPGLVQLRLEGVPLAGVRP